jgi:hypothetical protein
MQSEETAGSVADELDVYTSSFRESSSWLGCAVFQSAGLIVCGLLLNASSAIGGSTLGEPVPFFLCFEL